MQFSNTSGLSTPTDLIPNGFLCWVLVGFRGMKNSQEPNKDGGYGRYADMEFTIADKQPLARKKLWDIVMDPDHGDNTEGARNMGMASLTRMIESAGLVNPEEPASYEKFNGKSCEEIMTLLDGKFVAIRAKVEKGGNGYADKNKVGDYLSPNKAGSTFKNYTKLVNGDHGVAVTGQQQGARSAGGFGGAGSAAPQTGSAPVRQGGFGGGQQQPQQSEQHSLDDTFNGNRTAAPGPAQQGAGGQDRGFNPNSTPAFLAHHNR